MEIKTSKTNSELWVAVSAALEKTKKELRPSGPGWFNVHEFSAKFKYSESKSKRLIKKLEDAGLVDVQVMAPATGGRVRFFRLK